MIYECSCCSTEFDFLNQGGYMGADPDLPAEDRHPQVKLVTLCMPCYSNMTTLEPYVIKRQAD